MLSRVITRVALPFCSTPLASSPAGKQAIVLEKLVQAEQQVGIERLEQYTNLVKHNSQE